jgi:Chalcone isomerase-like
MLRRSIVCAAAAAAVMMGLTGPLRAQTLEVGNTKFAPTASVGGSNLQLNGAGMRYKVVVKVYAAALYTQSKVSTAEAAIAAAGPKRVHVVMQRAIDARELGKLFTEGMRKNAPREEFSKSIPGTIKMGEIFAEKKTLESGDTFFADYIPGQGTQVIINGKQYGETIKEPEFYRALLSIWVGKDPADWKLKDALLGAKD